MAKEGTSGKITGTREARENKDLVKQVGDPRSNVPVLKGTSIPPRRQPGVGRRLYGQGAPWSFSE